jgi:hypothetical protein
MPGWQSSGAEQFHRPSACQKQAKDQADPPSLSQPHSEIQRRNAHLKAKGTQPMPRPKSSLAGFRIYQAAGLLVFVSTIALLGLMFLLAWSPTLLASFLVAGLVLLLLARSLFFFRVTLIVL